MSLCSLTLHGRTFAYAIPQKALARWVKQRLRQEARANGAVVYSFTCSGSTCTNRPLEIIMTVGVATDGLIQFTSSRPASMDVGSGAMCAAQGDGCQFLCDAGNCVEAIGLTLEQAAFHDWAVEPSGCFCTAGNRRHKWRNVFQALHYAATHVEA